MARRSVNSSALWICVPGKLFFSSSFTFIQKIIQGFYPTGSEQYPIKLNNTVLHVPQVSVPDYHLCFQKSSFLPASFSASNSCFSPEQPMIHGFLMRSHIRPECRTYHPGSVNKYGRISAPRATRSATASSDFGCQIRWNGRTESVPAGFVNPTGMEEIPELRWRKFLNYAHCAGLPPLQVHTEFFPQVSLGVDQLPVNAPRPAHAAAHLLGASPLFQIGPAQTLFSPARTPLLQFAAPDFTPVCFFMLPYLLPFSLVGDEIHWSADRKCMHPTRFCKGSEHCTVSILVRIAKPLSNQKWIFSNLPYMIYGKPSADDHPFSNAVCRTRWHDRLCFHIIENW